MGVHLSAYDPYNSKSAGSTRTLHTTNCEAEEKGGVDLQGVLVCTLDTVENGPSFRVVAVHLRILDIVLLAGFANFIGQMSDHYDTGNASQHHISILFGKHNHPGKLTGALDEVNGCSSHVKTQTDRLH